MAVNNTISLTIHQGDSVSFPVSFAAGGSAMNLTGDTFEGKIAKDYTSDPIASFVVTETNLSNGQITLTLSASVTAALPVIGKQSIFPFDVERTTGGLKEKVIYGNLIVKAEITR